MTLRVRELDLEDAVVAADVRCRFIEEDRQFPPGGLSESFVTANLTFIQQGMASGCYRSWIAEDSGGAIAGGVGLLLNRMPPRPEDLRTAEAWIIAMWVDTDLRRAGVGRSLLNACLGAADGWSVRRLLLWSTVAGAPLYASAGFASAEMLMQMSVE